MIGNDNTVSLSTRQSQTGGVIAVKREGSVPSLPKCLPYALTES